MRSGPVSLAVLTLVVACKARDETMRPARRSLRVSVSGGLAPMVPPVKGTVTAYLADLVFRPLHDHFASLQVSGRRVRLVRRPDSHLSAASLATSFRHEALVDAAATDDGIEVTFATEEDAAALLLDEYPLEVGPYRVADYSPSRLRLVARAPGRGPAEIDVRDASSAEEEWRMLLGREVDVMASVTLRDARHLREVPSIRVVPLARPSGVSLIFSMRSPTVPPVAARRAISLAIRRRALAATVEGDADLAFDGVEDQAAARTMLAALGVSPEHPLTLRVGVYAPIAFAHRAALVLQQQLAPLGVELTILSLGYQDLQTGSIAGTYDALVFWGSLEPEKLPALVSEHLVGLAGGSPAFYSNAEFDAAIIRGDLAAARAIAERDVPLVPLFRLGEAAAMDRSLCGARPQRPTDYSWLADLHPCAPGETE